MDNERIDGLTMDIEAADRDKLKAVFPQCFTDGRLDIDKLLNLCGEYISDDFEKYEFRWKGKTEALQLAGKRSTGTLRPCREDSVNWDETQNIYIEGDNLEVLKLLQTSYFRKVKMIYIDPPYNTGNDFVYADDFADPLARYKEVTQQTTKSNPETMGRFHTNWLNMMYPRLRLAANLLRDDGVIFISIDDGEVHNLRKICDEIFGEENFVTLMIWHCRQNKDNRNISGASIDHEYVLCYTKQPGWRVLRGTNRKTEQYKNPDNDPRGPWASANMVGLATADARPNLHYDLIQPETGINYGCPAKGWRYDKNTMKRLVDEGRILWPDSPEGRPRKKAFLNELDDNLPGYSSILAEGMYTNTGTKEIAALFDGHFFDFPKPSLLIKQLVSQATDKDDIILDFFSGSATTAHAVMQLNAEDGGNRRFILVQLPEVCDEKSEAFKAGYPNICEIGKARIRKAGEKIKADSPLTTGELDTGFRVFKLDSSNLNLWDGSPIRGYGEDAEEELYQRLLDHLEILKSDRQSEDVVFEVMLKLGQDLCEVAQPLDVNGKMVYGVGAEVKFIVCLADDIQPEDASAMAEYAPGRIVFADSCFSSTEQKSNVRLTLKDKGITIKTL
ncbi:site-specific DNA-methyltransferase [Ruminococcaceae bacterium OttesenSCG-928-L11]|nr:site-specific DNA-methyltransferase [Ruminococcaceae bacterium OttesenSCG-928-L11]